MMTSLFLHGQGATKIRFWVDELPSDAELPRSLKTEYRVLEGVGTSAMRELVAIEMFRGFGASFHYGLLGGVFEKSSSTDFQLIVPVEDPNSVIPLTGRLCGELDHVSIGGGDEFAKVIFDAIEELDKQTLPGGTLTITCMAQGAIGSAPAVFSTLTRALIRMITQAEVGTSFDDAMSLLAA